MKVLGSVSPFVLNSLTGVIGSALNTRYITKFNSSLNQYIDLSSAIVLNSDFKIDFSGVMESEGTTTLLGLANSGFSRIQRVATTTTSTIRFRLSGYDVDLPDDIVTVDGKWRKHTLERVNNTFNYYESDVLVSSITDEGADGRVLGFNCIGQGNNFNYLDSYYGDLVVEDNGTVVLDMSLDGDGTNGVVYNNAATLGAELDVSTLVTPNSLTTGIVYNNEDSEVTLVDSVGGLSHALALFNDKVLDGSHYLVTITIDTTASSVGAFLGVANSSDPSTERVTASAGEIQTFTQVLSPVGSGSLIFRLIGISALDDTVVFSNISIKEIPSSTPYGTRINMTSANTERFTLYDTYWRGSEELWAYSPITLDGSVTLYNTIAGGYGVLPENEDYIIDLQWDNLTGRFKLLVGDSEFVSNLIGSVVAETGSKSLVFSTLTSQRAVIQELDDSGTVADSMVASINRVLEIAA